MARQTNSQTNKFDWSAEKKKAKSSQERKSKKLDNQFIYNKRVNVTKYTQKIPCLRAAR